MKKFLVSLLAVALIGMVFGLGAAADSGRATEGEPVEILIGFDRAPDQTTYNSLKAKGWDVTGELSQINVLVVTLQTLPGEAKGEALNRAEQALQDAPGIPDVSYVEINGTMYAHGQTTPWGVERIGAPEAHTTSKGNVMA